MRTIVSQTYHCHIKFLNFFQPQIREKGFHAGRDEQFDAFILDETSEDKLLDELEPTMSAGGNVVEFHTVDFFPERWFDLVLVLRTDNTTLFDRLTAR